MSAKLSGQLTGLYSSKRTPLSIARECISSNFFNSLLLSNSLNYRSKDRQTHIKISTERQGKRILLHVNDNGLGIDLEKYGNKLFGLNRRFHDHVEGKGLGLFITKAQVEMLNGKITVVSEPNVGTTFTISLPVM